MGVKCLDQYTASLILACLTLFACITRSVFLISLLTDASYLNQDAVINILLLLNMAVYFALGILSILLIYAIVKERHLLMIPWLFVALASVICEVIFIVYIIACGHSKDVLYLLIGTVLGIWVLGAIFSYFKVVRQDYLNKSSDFVHGYRYHLNRTNH